MDTPIKILLAEDDVNLGKVLTTYLEAKGYMVKHAGNGEMAYEMFCANDFDICLVDVMMPLKDGFTLAKEIRKMDKKIPIIFLTAKNFQEDMIEGLSIGGDDYITKPFSMEVLLARLQALLRRTIQEATKPEETVFQLGKTIFDINRQTLTLNEKETRLTTRESELLTMLIHKKNEVLEREYALKKIWGDDSYYNARSMDVYITKLRKYFKDDPTVQIINVHGIGFKLVI
ncbi:response regulator transcription factor [Bacteroidales bacterium OttesenSCG-928-L19]|nr:response regulator transcription factor [Bacteroidales bacterium OttesenSCG-928-L19]